jgi:hypothetical protein
MTPEQTDQRMERVEREDLLRQFREFFGVDVDGLVAEAWHGGFGAGLVAEQKRRAYIEDVLAKLKTARGF